jgi:hypothetical protein
MSIKEKINKLFGIEFYTIDIICTNCDYKGKVDIEVGHKLGINDKCPICRCHGTLEKEVKKCQGKQE